MPVKITYTEDQKYGLPEQKKYPMLDKQHVISAIKFFNYVDPKYEKQLAKAILARMKEYGMSFDDFGVGEDNRFSKYLPEQALVHHGIKGQKWGVRRFQNVDGSLTSQGKKRYSNIDKKRLAKDISRRKFNDARDAIPYVSSKIDFSTLKNYDDIKKSYDAFIKAEDKVRSKPTKENMLIRDKAVAEYLKQSSIAVDDLVGKYKDRPIKSLIKANNGYNTVAKLIEGTLSMENYRRNYGDDDTKY